MRKALFLTLLLLAGCGKPQPPAGKWEGGTDTNGTIVVARVEIGAGGLVRVSAPDITNLAGAEPETLLNERARLQADLVNAWDDVKPREFDFDGKTFRKPGGVAPQMVWNKDTNQMTLQLYIGANPALPVVLHPVSEFHDSPFGQG
jgi:hypothetical protein